MTTLLGSLIVFLGALLPEGIRCFRDWQDKKHEITLLNLQLEQQRQGHHERLQEIAVQADMAETNALYATYHAGVAWVDALNGSVRPVLAYAFFALYSAAKYMQFQLIHTSEARQLIAVLWECGGSGHIRGDNQLLFWQPRHA